MTIETLAAELGGKRSGRGFVVPCVVPDHEDNTASLHLQHGRTVDILVHCFGGCPQEAVIEELRQRGLWSSPSPSPTAMRRERLRELLDAGTAVTSPPPPCCLVLQPKCEHSIAFEREYLMAHLFANLEDAAREVVHLYQTAGEPLTVDELIDNINFSIPFGAIVPHGIDDADVIAKAIVMVATEALRQ